ncbi:helix-hairpin-helix domain-containing protein [Streptococcus dentapri]|uniref:Helix-hairpin-helix domain-containing protein n=1 Tax=Streptococcus dentapri TaxID=573564 RepID=A0ABV8D2W5_9STRE
MSKQKNRKKALKLQMKRQGLLKSQLSQTTAVPAKKAPKTSAPKTVTAQLSQEEFSALKEVADVRANLVETLYEAGIHSAADFAAWTEKDLLGLKGIGPATVKKLQENGVSLKG